MNIIDYLRENNACSDGIEYLENKIIEIGEALIEGI